MSLFVVMSTMAVLTSCSKEEQIIGKWKFVDLTIELPNSSDSDSQTYIDFFHDLFYDEFEGIMWEFKADNIVVASDSDGELSTANYSVDGSILTMDDEEGHLVSYEIKTLTGSKMILYKEEEQEDVLLTMEIEFSRM